MKYKSLFLLFSCFLSASSGYAGKLDGKKALFFSEKDLADQIQFFQDLGFSKLSDLKRLTAPSTTSQNVARAVNPSPASLLTQKDEKAAPQKVVSVTDQKKPAESQVIQKDEKAAPQKVVSVTDQKKPAESQSKVIQKGEKATALENAPEYLRALKFDIEEAQNNANQQWGIKPEALGLDANLLSQKDGESMIDVAQTIQDAEKNMLLFFNNFFEKAYACYTNEKIEPSCDMKISWHIGGKNKENPDQEWNLGHEWSLTQSSSFGKERIHIDRLSDIAHLFIPQGVSPADKELLKTPLGCEFLRNQNQTLAALYKDLNFIKEDFENKKEEFLSLSEEEQRQSLDQLKKESRIEGETIFDNDTVDNEKEFVYDFNPPENEEQNSGNVNVLSKIDSQLKEFQVVQKETDSQSDGQSRIQKMQLSMRERRALINQQKLQSQEKKENPESGVTSLRPHTGIMSRIFKKNVSATPQPQINLRAAQHNLTTTGLNQDSQLFYQNPNRLIDEETPREQIQPTFNQDSDDEKERRVPGWREMTSRPQTRPYDERSYNERIMHERFFDGEENQGNFLNQERRVPGWREMTSRPQTRPYDERSYNERIMNERFFDREENQGNFLNQESYERINQETEAMEQRLKEFLQNQNTEMLASRDRNDEQNSSIERNERQQEEQFFSSKHSLPEEKDYDAQDERNRQEDPVSHTSLGREIQKEAGSRREEDDFQENSLISLRENEKIRSVFTRKNYEETPEFGASQFFKKDSPIIIDDQKERSSFDPLKSNLSQIEQSSYHEVKKDPHFVTTSTQRPEDPKKFVINTDSLKMMNIGLPFRGPTIVNFTKPDSLIIPNFSSIDQPNENRSSSFLKMHQSSDPQSKDLTMRKESEESKIRIFNSSGEQNSKIHEKSEKNITGYNIQDDSFFQ